MFGLIYVELKCFKICMDGICMDGIYGGLFLDQNFEPQKI